jgi:hypothetical protein
MKPLDIYIQKWRIKAAAHYIKPNSRIIDIGAHEGELFHALGSRLQEGFGIEPLLKQNIVSERFCIVPGRFPTKKPDTTNWDAVTMLAVLEHIPCDQHEALSLACHMLLVPNGRLIITVPSNRVDFILRILSKFKLIDGMSLEQHYGFNAEATPNIFSPPAWGLLVNRKFQFGLNNLYVFERK